MSSFENPYLLRVTPLAFEGDFVVLETEPGDRFRWPRRALPLDIQLGTSFGIQYADEHALKKEHERIAKHILNQLLS